MLLNERVETIVRIQREGVGLGGRPYMEAALVSDDAQTLHLYEGQLKEVSGVDLEIGETYKVVFQPLSKVFHFEGVSNGTDLGSGIKKSRNTTSC